MQAPLKRSRVVACASISAPGKPRQRSVTGEHRQKREQTNMKKDQDILKVEFWRNEKLQLLNSKVR